MPIFLKVNHQLESRMQEICQSGSEGGAKLSFVPTPISAQGFNQVSTLGRACHQVARPERAQERIRIGCSLYRNHIRLLAIPNLPPFQGGSLFLCVDPGLKPG